MANGLGELAFGIVRPRLTRFGALLDAGVAVRGTRLGVIDSLTLLRPFPPIASRLRPT